MTTFGLAHYKIPLQTIPKISVSNELFKKYTPSLNIKSLLNCIMTFLELILIFPFPKIKMNFFDEKVLLYHWCIDHVTKKNREILEKLIL
jgi:hypothetical protein